ncbi:MAG: hypothetical protein CMD81_08140 [Gammaproteobacteria bacterium]|nr:hypothetical protein [Gammaproteobacteria bacterium]MBK82302.1 hypothetical protein [Gammaproteobacteria bacterium]MBK83786.1 hypothetical protein [Gammaproteobacteria bacterium]|tara:strand:+ start:194 stop:445 length:252 start_codon:yes stop_codon:yes gene_type:complete
MNSGIFDALASTFGYIGGLVIQFGIYAVYGVGGYYLIKIMYPIAVGKGEGSDLSDRKIWNRFVVTTAIWFAVSLYHVKCLWLP